MKKEVFSKYNVGDLLYTLRGMEIISYKILEVKATVTQTSERIETEIQYIMKETREYFPDRVTISEHTLRKKNFFGDKKDIFKLITDQI